MAAKIYDATYILARAFDEVIAEGGDVYNGTAVFNKMRNRFYTSEFSIFALFLARFLKLSIY